MAYLLPLICLSAGFLAARVAIRVGHGRVVAVWSLVLALGGLGTIVAARGMPGMEGLGLVIIGGLVLVPALLGSGLGAAWGLPRRRRARQERPHD